jgi:magnesium chelatase family protein
VLGVLPAAIGATARDKGLICPYHNGSEAAWSGNELILAPKNLLELINHFKGTQILKKPSAEIDQGNITYPDLADIKGQETAKRALEIAAAGGHNMLMCGPPGAGKSMLAQRLPGLLPPMDSKEMLECSMIASLAGLLTDGKLQSSRPFRAPHHSCSMAAMVGGGMSKRISPGEISIAHHGVLFLDELPEFQRVVLDSLRQPIETGDILISRAHAHITYPAKFQLIAAMNPCCCGYLSDPERACNKVPRCAVDYQGKISGPLFDRIDIYIEVGSLSIMEIENATPGESSAVVAARVTKARELQKLRYHNTDITINARLDSSLIQKFVVLNDDAKKLLNKAVEDLKLSMRGYNRILKVARTIADLEEKEIINKIHIAEALSYRQMTIKRN